MSMVRLSSSTPKQGQGFGIVEIMIAMALGIVIILGVTTLFTDTSRTLEDINRSGRQLENSLFSLELLATELAMVGYWGEAGYPLDAETQIFVSGEDLESAPGGISGVPSACLGTGAIIDGTSDDAKAELGYGMEFPVSSATGADLNSEISSGVCNNSSAPVARATSEYVLIRRASSCATGVSPIPANNSCRELGDFYHLQTNGCYSENLGLSGGEIKLYKVTADTASALLPYTGYDCTSSAPIYRYISRIYYVDQNDTLTRLYLENDSSLKFKSEALVDGVELLRFEWFIDTSGDGEYDLVSRGPSASQWSDIVAVRVWTVTRSSIEESGYTDTNTYTIAGESWTVPSGNEGYRRTVQSRTVELINIAGRRR
jgi:type IV pilus assembly protein PilW